MPALVHPITELSRLTALRGYDILDTPRERDFDEVAQLASAVCGTPIAVVNLIGEGRQFFKAEVGLGVRETPLETSFCSRAILEEEFMLVPDATKDARFQGNPLVVSDPHLRFYAGALLKTDEGHAIGTVCVLDYQPRELTDVQQQTLRVLARQVMKQLELRRALRERRAEDLRHRQILDSAIDYAIVTMDLSGHVTGWNMGAELILGWTEAEMRGKLADAFFTAEDIAARIPEQEMRAALEHGRGDDERWHQRKDGSRFFALGEMMPLTNADGTPLGYLKILRDRTTHRRTEDALREAQSLNAPILASSRDCIVLLDLDGHTLFVSPGGIEAMEIVDVDAIIGLSWLRVWTGADKEAAVAAVTEARAGGTGRFQGYCPTHKGTPKWWDVVISPLLGPDGRPERLVSSGRDISLRRQVELRQAALVDLSDRLSDLADPLEMTFAACEVLGRALEVSRVGYGLVDKVAETITIERDWNAPGIASLAGVLRFRDYGSYIEDLKRGESVVFADAEVDPRTQATAAALKAISAQAVVNMPLVEQGQFVALLYANHARARPWSQSDLALMREVAERVRSATERVRAQEAQVAQAAELERLNALLAVQVAASTQDLDRIWRLSPVLKVVGTLTGDIIAVNPAWTRTLGWEEAETIDRNIMKFIAPEDRDVGAAGMPLLEAGEPVIDFENTFATKDGGRRRIAWNTMAEAGFLYGFGRDITVEVQAAQALAARTAERDRLWETTNDLMATAGLDGYLKAINPAWTPLLGWSEVELLTRPFFEIIDPADHAETVNAVARLAAGRSVAGFVDRVLVKDGTKRTIMWTAVPEGAVFYIVGRDLTEQRHAEDALRQSQKMEAVGQLTGGLAHDFNNLLAGISGSLELMQTRMSQGRIGDLDRYMTVAQGAAKRAAALTHRLLAFSRRQTLDPKPTDVNRLISGMEELIRRTVGPAVHIEVVGASGLWPALIDPGQLENALLNLCINARDAMPEGGRITIETANKWLDRPASIKHDIPEGQYLSLCVTDTGTGMTPEVIARVFEPFFTTKPIGEGTGLGLSMIYGFAQQSGGQVRIYSELGEGTTVCLYLPRHYGEADADEVALKLEEVARAEQGETVLIVDDEPSVRMLVTEVLEDLGYTAIEAADSVAGLKLLQSNVRVDLLVTDVGLPGGMNGRQMADAGRERRPDLRVLFITGYAENSMVGNGHLGPGMQVLTKPFAMEALASRIKDLITSR